MPVLKQAMLEVGILKDTENKNNTQGLNGTNGSMTFSDEFWTKVQSQYFDDENNLTNTQKIDELSEATGVHPNRLKELFVQGVNSLQKDESDCDQIERPYINVRLKPGQEEAIVREHAAPNADSGVS